MATTYAISGDIRVTETLGAQFLLLLANRVSVVSDPAILYAGNVTMSGSTTRKIPQIGLMGYDLLALDASENTSITDTALTDGSGTVTVQRYAKVYTPTDLLRLTDSQGMITEANFALDGFVSAQQTITNLIANLCDNFGNGVGASGVNTDLATWIAAQSALEARNAIASVGMLHSAQWGHIREELALVSGGAITFAPATQQQIGQVGQGLKGELLGTRVIVNNFVPLSGSDRVGAMWGLGAIATADGTPPIDNPVEQRYVGGGVMFERVRNGRQSQTQMITSMYYGTAIQIDDAGESITGAGS